MKQLFENKVVLVTGGVGSIGSEIVRQLLQSAPKQIRILDNRETEAFHMQNELAQHSSLRFLIGDVRDKERLSRAMENVDIVFHAAALKHVPLCEYNPFEAVKTNVLGTQNIIDCALENDVEKVINISTDKVTNTINTMGATKLLAERLITAAQYYRGNRRTAFCSVRFGNVLKSNGSVIEVFESQIRNNSPITITDPAMTRFFMSIPQAVKLVFKALELTQGGEIFILKMPAIRLKELADVIVEEIAPKYNFKPSDLKQKFIGLRPGERLYEDLMTEEEAETAMETDELFIVLPMIVYSPQARLTKHTYPNARKSQVQRYSSKTTPLLDKEGIRALLRKEKLL